MSTQPQNIKYSLKEYNKKNKEEVGLTFDELENFIEEKEKEMNTSCEEYDDNYSEMFFLLEQEYNENYTKKELELIAGYYEISKRKKRKLDLIQEIIIFEQNDLNYDIVEKRKLHWFYLEQLREDPYLKQFIIINN
tara:strand:+ start:4799 stop:5206 length:408 start_codon:yes stop_codon:yes gene_type:complete